MLFSFKLLSFVLLRALQRVVCQKPVVLEVESLPSPGGAAIPTFTSERGTLRHFKSFKVSSTDEIGVFRSFIASPCGHYLLAVTDSNIFASIIVPWKLEDEGSDHYRATLLPMRDIEFGSDGGAAEGLTINGVYEGNGRGELYVTYKNDNRVMKFPNGVFSSSALDISVPSSVCSQNGAVKAISKSHNNSRLLLVCETPEDPEGEANPTVAAWAYDTVSGEASKFYIRSKPNFYPTGMDELSNGAIMMLWKRFDDGGVIEIVFISAESLNEAINSRSVAVPEIVGYLSGQERWAFGDVQDLAARQEVATNRTFVYILGDHHPSDNRTTLLTAFEWIPSTNPLHVLSSSEEVHPQTMG